MHALYKIKEYNFYRIFIETIFNFLSILLYILLFLLNLFKTKSKGWEKSCFSDVIMSSSMNCKKSIFIYFLSKKKPIVALVYLWILFIMLFYSSVLVISSSFLYSIF